MKFQRSRQPANLQLATAGMIDIVFLLLIFFLVNSSFRPVERQVESRLMDSSAAVQAPLDPLIVRLRVLDQNVNFRVGGREFSARIDLLEWLRQWPERDQPLMIVASSATPVAEVIGTLNECRNLGFTKVSYVPDQSPDSASGL